MYTFCLDGTRHPTNQAGQCATLQNPSKQHQQKPNPSRRLLQIAMPCLQTMTTHQHCQLDSDLINQPKMLELHTQACPMQSLLWTHLEQAPLLPQLFTVPWQTHQTKMAMTASAAAKQLLPQQRQLQVSLPLQHLVCPHKEQHQTPARLS